MKAYYDQQCGSIMVIQNTAATGASATIRCYTTTGGEVAGSSQSQTIPTDPSWIVHRSANPNLPYNWAGSASTTVSIQYKFGSNTYYQTVSNLQPGASALPFLPNASELDPVDGLYEL